MTLIRRNNSKNWYYQFQIQGKKFFGSTGTPNKTKAAQVEREMRNRAHAEQSTSGMRSPLRSKMRWNNMSRHEATRPITGTCARSFERRSAISFIRGRRPSSPAMACRLIRCCMN